MIRDVIKDLVGIVRKNLDFDSAHLIAGHSVRDDNRNLFKKKEFDKINKFNCVFDAKIKTVGLCGSSECA